jgi:HEAT repeat protein/beta-lactamase regulating signal transducer with metallopeptidase domain
MNSTTVGTWLLTYAVHSTVALTAVWLVTRRFRQPALADVLWKLGLVGSLVTATAPSFGVAGAGARLALDTAPRPVAPFKGQPEPPKTAAPAIEASANDEAKVSIVLPAARSRWSGTDLAVAAWAVAAGLMVLAFAGRRWQLARRLGNRRVVVGHEAVDEIDALRRLAGVQRRVVLTVSGRLSSPIAVGYREISVPEKALVELDPEERRNMLAHELAHLIRLDPLWLSVAVLVERVFFFQPLNRLARRRIQSSAELLCDRWAAERTGSPVTLASCLVKVAEWIDAAPRPIPVAGMAEERSELVERVKRLVEEAPMQSPVRRRWLVGVGLAALAGIVAFAPRVSLEGQDSIDRSPNAGRPNQAASDTGSDPVADPAERRQQSQDTGAVVPALIAALRDQSAEVRRAAAQSLGNLEDRRATNGLIALLDDEDTNVRMAAVEALGQLEDRRSVSALVARMSDPSKEIRRGAMRALAQMKDAVGVEVFRGALADEDAETRRAALYAVAERRDKASAPVVAGLVKDRDPEVRQAALQALGELKDPKSVDAIVGALTDPSSDVRQAALQALGNLELEALPGEVLPLLGDRDADVRQAAAWMAGNSGDARAVPRLKDLLTDSNASVREAAVEALSEIRDAAAIDALVGGLKSSDPVVRRAAAEALGQRKEH